RSIKTDQCSTVFDEASEIDKAPVVNASGAFISRGVSVRGRARLLRRQNYRVKSRAKTPVVNRCLTHRLERHIERIEDVSRPSLDVVRPFSFARRGRTIRINLRLEEREHILSIRLVEKNNVATGWDFRPSPWRTWHWGVFESDFFDFGATIIKRGRDHLRCCNPIQFMIEPVNLHHLLN